MLDNRLIDVVVGLVLVFALSGMAVSVLHEAWISMPWKRSRGDNLLKAIGSMMGDDGGSSGSLVLALGKGPALSAFTDELMKQPLLQSQVLGPSRPAQGKGPSYLQPEVFVSALVAFLTQRYSAGQRPATPREWVSAVLAGAPQARRLGASAPNDAFVAALQSLADGAADDWPTYEKRLCAWYEAVMERAQGWFQRDTQARLFCMGFALAALLNLNAITVMQRLWNDAPMRAAFVGAAQQASKVYEAASAPVGSDSPAEAAALAALATPTPGSVPTGLPAAVVPRSLQVDQALKRYKEALFRTAEVRSKHRLGEATLALEDALERVLDLEVQIVQRRQSLGVGPYPQATFEFSEQIERRVEAMAAQLAGATHDSALMLLRELEEALKAERRALLPRSIGKLRPPGACDAISDEKARALCHSVNDINELSAASLPIGWNWANWPGCHAECRARHATTYQSLQADHYEKLVAKPGEAASDVHVAYDNALKATERASCSHPSDGLAERCESGWWDADAILAPWAWVIAVLGWAIVGVASMLGAPFWFDLLSKLVKVRGSGAKIDTVVQDAAGDAAGGGDAAKRTVLTPPPTPAPAAAPDTAPQGTVVPVPSLAPAPAAPQMADTPRRSDGTITVLGEQEVRALYGDFRTIPDPAKPGHVLFASPQEAAKRPLVVLQHAALATVAPAGVSVHARAAIHFQHVFDEIFQLGWQSDIVDCGGTISMRHIMRDPAKPLSRHCWGIAIDLNTQANGYGVTPPTSGHGNLMRLAPIFEKHGFAWGGRFTTGVDGMHFELALRQP